MKWYYYLGIISALALVWFGVVQARLSWSYHKVKKNSPSSRGWTQNTYTNFVHFVLHNGSTVISLEKGDSLGQILRDITFTMNHESFYRISYPDPPTAPVGDRPAMPENHEGTPWLEMMLPHAAVDTIWFQRKSRA